MATSARIIALYFPQLHPIPENDRWWGAGFTDWVNVKKAKPLFPGHHQPRVPLGQRYYDQSQDDVIRWQVDLAREHGIYGFCHYHYWFDGKQLLETPTNRFLAARDLKFPFCLAWANESWSRRWDGREHEMLVRQTHPVDKARWDLHFDYLIRCWSDERAIKVDGRPVFVIYRPHLVTEIGSLFDHWRERAHRAGLPGLYFVAMNQHGLDEVMTRHFDAVANYEPSLTYFTSRASNPWRRGLGWLARRLPPALSGAKDRLLARLDRRLPAILDYDRIWETIVTRPLNPGITTFPGAFVDWDNSARYGWRALAFRGASPERFAFWLRRLVGGVSENPPDQRIILLTAWNEWAEGAYLEPDERHQLGYLEAVRCVVQG